MKYKALYKFFILEYGSCLNMRLNNTVIEFDFSQRTFSGRLEAFEKALETSRRVKSLLNQQDT